MDIVLPAFVFVCHRYDPGTTVSDDITTEADRVLFLQSIAHSMLTKARIKLNIKHLYAADAVAVKDLLSMAALLYKATRTTADFDEVLHFLLAEKHLSRVHPDSVELFVTG